MSVVITSLKYINRITKIIHHLIIQSVISNIKQISNPVDKSQISPTIFNNSPFIQNLRTVPINLQTMWLLLISHTEWHIFFTPKSVSPLRFSFSTSFLRFTTSWSVPWSSNPEIISTFFYSLKLNTFCFLLFHAFLSLLMTSCSVL